MDEKQKKGHQLNDQKMDVRAIVARMYQSYISRYTRHLIVAIFWMIISASMTGVFAWIIGPMMDEVMVKGNQNLIFPIAGVLLVCLAMRGISTYMHTIKMAVIGHSMVADIQRDLFSHMIRLDLKFFQNNHSGSLVARLISI